MNYMNKTLNICICLFISLSISGQNTVGLISYKKDKSFDGYNLIYPHNQPHIYLLNNCGEVVHSWKDSIIWRPGNTAYITKEGKLIKTKRNNNISGNPIWFGGGGAIVEIRDWNNSLEWTYEVNDTINRLHHDIAPMPNGNILMIVWQKRTKTELIATGRDTSRFKETVLHSDYIIEVNPKTNQVVWRWNMWDHMIQDYDATKANYGIVANNPEKININYPSQSEGSSWLHTNSIDYNEELDQIMVSIPTYNEIWVIDHSTTTTQAVGSIGGLSGKGGDLIYRWGNPATYNKSNVINQTLFFQHDAKWINNFINAADPNYGKISVFNNRAGIDFSTANFFIPPWDMYEWRYQKTMGTWGPVAPELTVKHPTPTKLYSTGLSSFDLLPNKNVLIISGRDGYAFELTPDNQIVWEYKVPLKNGNAVNQGAILSPNDNTTFRINRYPVNYTAFQGKDLSPKGFIELIPNIGYCNKLVSNEDIILSSNIRIFPNPASDLVNVFVATPTAATILSSDGTKIKDLILDSGKNEVFISDLKAGLYFINTENGIIKAFSVVK